MSHTHATHVPSFRDASTFTSTSAFIPFAVRAACLALSLLAGSSLAASNQFCGGPVPQTGDPSDLAHVVGDQTLEALAEQPASMMVCSKGYLFEKCGDHATALRIFDRCIAAGYVGAMIWKALMLQDGAGMPRDLKAAAELMRQAAMAGDSPYATLGKLHYASALHEGKGVERNEAEARKWFEAAAAEGNPDAQEFLATGYHVGDRDGNARGVGEAPPSAAALAVPLPMPAELRDAVPAAPHAPASAAPVLARTLSQAPARTPEVPVSAPLPVPAAVQPPAPVGAHLQAVEKPGLPVDEERPAVVAGLLLTLLALGGWHQAMAGRRVSGRVLAGSVAHV
jgi:Sel1 repeat